MNKSDVPIQISVIVPVGKRHAETLPLYAEYKAGLEKAGASYEVIYVLDGKHDDVAAALKQLQIAGENIVVVSLSRVFGEATALTAGFERASGSVILTLPAYYQIIGDEIPKLLEALNSADVVVGCREPRVGGRMEALRRAGFHKIVSKVTGLNLNDLGCGAQAMKRKVLEEIFLYGDQHRFLAVLADRQGFRVTEVPVRQSTKDHFEGRYRLREYAHRVLDIITVLFLVRFTKKPLRFFGMIGVSTFLMGALLLFYLVLDRVLWSEPLADRPALLLASLLAVMGLQLFAIGLLGELIIFTHARDIKDYQVSEVIQFPLLTDGSASDTSDK